LRIVEADAVIGAEVTGVDLREPMDAATFEALEAAFNARSILCIRGQELSTDQYIAFATRFGDVEHQFMTHYAHADSPDIMLISNIQVDGRNIGHSDAGRVWHSDMSYTATPPRATLLYALEVPEADGRALGGTDFASAAAAYAGLDAETKAIIEDRTSLHRISGRRQKAGTSATDNPLRDQQPDVTHAVARSNPFTGKRAIYVSEGECVSVSGLDDVESRALVDRLAQETQKPDYRYSHVWAKGDVLIWDNGAVQHLATFDYQWPDHRRLMWRITVGGAKG
jgi:taurine dioxygenase